MPIIRDAGASLRAYELASDARSGSFARNKARQRHRAYFRRHVWTLTGVWFLLMSVTPAVWWWLESDFVRGALVGANFTGATASVLFWVVQVTATAPIMMGDQAERYTAQEIRRARRGWRLINGFRLGHGDIDHIAIGPAGLVILETKWSAASWASLEGVERQRRAVEQVQRSARQLTRWHELKKLGLRAHSVVVLWGGEAMNVGVRPIATRDGETWVVPGPSLMTWLRTLPAEPAIQESQEQAWRAIAKQAALRDRSDGYVAPRTAGQLLLRAASCVFGVAAGFLVVAMTLDWSGSWVIAALMGSGWTSIAVATAHQWPLLRLESALSAVSSGCSCFLALVALLFG